MLFTNSSTGADTANAGNTTNMYYWLGSLFVHTYAGHASFGVRRVSGGFVHHYSLYISGGAADINCFGVRPVVSLDSKVRLKDSGTVHDGCKLYNMSFDK